MCRLTVCVAAVERHGIHSMQEDLEHAALRLHFFASPVLDTVVHVFDRAEELVDDVCGFAAARSVRVGVDDTRRWVKFERA